MADRSQDRSQWADFEVHRELGRGTWGTVVLARRRQDGNFYALKLVQLDKRSQRDQLAAVQECQLLASLDSPHITRYYDSFLHDGRLVIVMEWAPGGSLHAAIGRSPRPLPEDVIWRVLLHIGLALHHMHSRRMLHRDVKSLNVFLTGPLDSQGKHTQFKLGDVGVSKVLDEGKNHASTLIGTPYYLSPEICQEKPYDAKSDIWALGVVLYECATRRHPFDAQSQPSLIMKILRGRYEPVVGLSPDLTAIINRCLSQAAARRPSAERLLCQPAVRAKAAELGIDIPQSILAAAGSPGSSLNDGDCFSGGSAARKSVLPGLRVVADARGAAAPRPQPLPSRRQTCPHGAPPTPVGLVQARAAVIGRRSTPHGEAEGRRVSIQGAERRKPPLPAAAVPGRRQTEQQPKGQLLSSLEDQPSGQGAASPIVIAAPIQVSVQPAAPLQAGLAAVAAFASPLPRAQALSPAALPLAGEEEPVPVFQQPSPRRHSHFSVTKHLRAMSGAAAQWLAQRGADDTSGSAASSDAMGSECSSATVARLPSGEAAMMSVERSAKSDSALLSHAGQQEAATPALPALAEAPSEDVSAAVQALRQRCITLLGSEALFQELHSLASGAVEGGVGEGAAATQRPLTMAALGDALFARVGYSGNAAEALHLLMRMLAVE